MKLNDSIIIEARELAFAQRVRRESSKIWHLGDELFMDAVRAYAGGVSFGKIRVMMREAGVLDRDLPSQTAWVRFWRRFQPFLRVARRRAMAKGATGLMTEAQKSPGEFDVAVFELIRQLIFELVESGGGDPKELSALVNLVLKHKQQRLKERMIEVAERRVALVEKREAERIREEEEERRPLTPEEQERRIKQIFGISEEWERANEVARERERGLNSSEAALVSSGAEYAGQPAASTGEHHETPLNTMENDGVASQEDRGEERLGMGEDGNEFGSL